MFTFSPRAVVASFVLLILILAQPSMAQDVAPEAGMMRYPHVSRTHIAFVYANDIWIVPREGGVATPLASPPGGEENPRFSPDGTKIAFVGNYDGARDIYVMPVTGGIPHRVTYHPGQKNFTGWTADGKRLIYASNFESGIRRAPRIYTISAEGGMFEQLPVPYGDAAAISPDGQWLAYTPHNADRRTWKRYRGGLASDIWLFNLNDNSSRQMTDWEGTDSLPMFAPGGDKVYYLADAGDEHRLNIWSYDMRTQRHEQITRFRDWDVKWPSMGPGPNGRGEIIFQNGPSIYLLDLQTRQTRAVNVRIPGARPQLRTQIVDAANFIQSFSISPNAKRVTVEARGDVWTLPAEKGSPRNLTRTSGVAERTPSWSPDGRWIAYLSDETGEYELYVRQSDGRDEPRQLTHDGGPYKYQPIWSPDSKHILFSDKTATAYLTTLESGETKKVDYDEWGGWGLRSASWSHDSRWITYAKQTGNRRTSTVWVYHVETGEKHQLTSGMFSDSSPVFDRKGEWLYFSSSRRFQPTYSNLDTTFIYNDAEVLVAVPLRADIKSPWLPESDEETWKKDEEKKDDQNGDDEEKKDDDDAEEAKPAQADDGVTGMWEGSVSVPEMGQISVRLSLTLGEGNKVSGSLITDFFSGALSGTYNPADKSLKLIAELPGMPPATFDLKIANGTMTGTAAADGRNIPITLQRQAGESDDKNGAKKDDKPAEEVKIDFEGFERRALMLPVTNGRFGQLAVNNNNQLLFTRFSSPGSAVPSGIKLFDLKDDKKQEQMVAAGAGSFDITADGKKILIVRGRGSSIQNASAGASGTTVPTGGMTAHIDPREEWQQLFMDVWRIQRDFFYVDNLHGVDWPAVRDHYKKMLADATTREDLSFILAEMISELNVGHAYYWGGDVEGEPGSSVGLLGVDFSLENGAYRIKTIHEGGPWDVDARGPLSQPGVDVKQGDYILAVNGVPVDVSRDPYAAFRHIAPGRAMTLTVSEKPEWDGEARDVIVEPLFDDYNLRYRAWIERNRKYVEEQTDGQVGYIYVPDTGVNGQNDLVRQYFGQLDKKALIIDERWNGGGQIPTRFIEMLNRPITNYWARRDNQDWPWPPDAHQGPKCMLINGPAGSGGDMFPWLFRHNNLGKLIGTRTWGGLVGISGNPTLIDGGYTAVPTFGFYTADGRWSIEGHGVDPDIHVIDDPAKMLNGADPQLDAAIKLMLEEIERNPYTPPARPAPPERAGWGIDPAHH
ncbi:MAG TPA: PDZ domain-containing protein [Phycisphaerales bacterium]|nr:PDZ domain-containing protein [Phycisphaerales bacterium]